MAEDHVDPELQPLTDRIAAVRAAIAEAKARRSRVRGAGTFANYRADRDDLDGDLLP